LATPGAARASPPEPVSLAHVTLRPYAPPRIGHARSKVIFDVLWRWRERSGYDVVLARNITDVDDKITVLRSCMRHVLNVAQHKHTPIRPGLRGTKSRNGDVPLSNGRKDTLLPARMTPGAGDVIAGQLMRVRYLGGEYAAAGHADRSRGAAAVALSVPDDAADCAGAPAATGSVGLPASLC
jgi:tRNA synthetase class I (C)